MEGLILSLETSTPACSIALHDQGKLLGSQSYRLDKSHSSLLPGILVELLANCGRSLKDLAGFAISSGPGSYTGLRIGLSTAKAICYVQNIPLISVGTLDTLIAQAKPWVTPSALIAPMLDARRMEVYTKLVTIDGAEVWPLKALILEEDSFGEFQGRELWLIGDGADKCRDFLSHPNLRICGNIHPSAAEMGNEAWSRYEKSQFEDLAYFEPNYLKAFHTKPPVNKLKV